MDNKTKRSGLKEGLLTKTPKKNHPNCSNRIKFISLQAYRNISRHKLEFCLSFFSVFLVVTFSILINTLSAQGPVMFLDKAEK